MSVAMTEGVDDFFTKSGPMPAVFDDVRRFPRFYFRSVAQATIHPFCGRGSQPQQSLVLTCDLSRGGVRLLHQDQLFPGQKIELLFNNQLHHAAEVSWCRRMAERKFIIGCRFAK